MNEKVLKVEKPFEDFEGCAREELRIEFEGGAYSEFLGNLVEVDLMQRWRDESGGWYRVGGYFEGLERVYKAGFEEYEVEVSEKVRKNYGKVVKDNFVHASNVEEYISFVQVLDALPGNMHPLCMSWQNRMKLSYLDVFLS